MSIWKYENYENMKTWKYKNMRNMRNMKTLKYGNMKNMETWKNRKTWKYENMKIWKDENTSTMKFWTLLDQSWLPGWTQSPALKPGLSQQGWGSAPSPQDKTPGGAGHSKELPGNPGFRFVSQHNPSESPWGCRGAGRQNEAAAWGGSWAAKHKRNPWICPLFLPCSGGRLSSEDFCVLNLVAEQKHGGFCL